MSSQEKKAVVIVGLCQPLVGGDCSKGSFTYYVIAEG